MKKTKGFFSVLVLMMGLQAKAQAQTSSQPQGRHERPEPSAEFKAAMKECLSAAGITVSENQRPDPRSMSESQRLQVHDCMSAKGIDLPGRPPHEGPPPSQSSQSSGSGVQ